ncbi:prx-13 [Pristionchus pacificus]|nr:prx-13 [Pristionchus pacificus]
MSAPPPPPPQGTAGPSSSMSVPPPLPPRPSDHSMGTMQQQAYGGYGNGMYGGGYGQFGGGMYGGNYGIGGYGGMGGYGGGYGGYSGGGYGMNPGMDGNFSRIAEESSRDTFRSIESVVNAVNAVANMLSSTHNAVYSSFRAVIGVVEQFGLLKGQFTSLLASFWIFKMIHRIWRYLLVMLRLKPANYASSEELAWSQANIPLGTDMLAGHSTAGPSMNWPAAMFWLVALGGPYLIYKSITSMVAEAEKKRQWAVGTGSHYSAVTLFDFQGSSDQELSFMANESLRVAPKEEQPRMRGWLLASSKEGDRIGLVPINYVRIISRQSTSPPPTAESTSLDNLNRAFHSGMTPHRTVSPRNQSISHEFRKSWEENNLE